MKLTNITKNRGRLQVYETFWVIVVLMDQREPAAGTYRGGLLKFFRKLRECHKGQQMTWPNFMTLSTEKSKPSPESYVWRTFAWQSC